MRFTTSVNHKNSIDLINRFSKFRPVARFGGIRANKGTDQLKHATAIAIFIWFLAVSVTQAFPTWIGTYGTYTRHDGNNPGEFKILQNQDYAALKAEVGIRINFGSWTTYPMSRQGTIDINSIWTFRPATNFPAGSTIEYYFHGFDGAGHIWDTRGGINYSFNFPAPRPMQWSGNVI